MLGILSVKYTKNLQRGLFSWLKKFLKKQWLIIWSAIRSAGRLSIRRFNINNNLKLQLNKVTNKNRKPAPFRNRKRRKTIILW